MIGLGFLIWQLQRVLPIESTIKTLKDIGAQWVSIKMLDYTFPWNLINEDGSKSASSEYLTYVISSFKNAGIEVGGWGFVYTTNVTGQARAVKPIVSKYGLSHWLVDAEDVANIDAKWKRLPKDTVNALAKEYMNNLGLGSGFPVALCSYRYPSYHSQFPFSAFVNHSANTHIAAQVYWMFANNPGFQLKKMVNEYNTIRKLPHVPIGASFAEHGWTVTADQIKEFVTVARDELKLPAWGFWDLDEAIKRPDWLAAMAGLPPPVLEPDPEPEQPTEKVIKLYKVSASSLNVRDEIIPSKLYGRAPGTVYKPSRVWFTLRSGDVVEALDRVIDGNNIWLRIGKKQYAAMRYDGQILIS
jgi:hypothetical protein